LQTETRAAQQLLGGVAHGLEPLQPKLQQRHHHLAGGFVVDRCLRHHQAALEVSQPGRHYEVVGGDLDALLAHRLDEFEILLGEREHGNLRQVDLVPAGQVEQQVERALVASNIDVKHVLVGRRRWRRQPIRICCGHPAGARKRGGKASPPPVRPSSAAPGRR